MIAPVLPGGQDGEIHTHFGLSYANYLVLARSVLQSMPLDWQDRFVGCLREVTAATRELPDPAYNVQVLRRPPEHIRFAICEECAGVGKDEQTGKRCDVCDGAGETEEDRYETPEEVGIVDDPIPHYWRGRTRVPLNLEALAAEQRYQAERCA